MSGPKSSRYRLSDRRRRQLAAELAEQRRRREEQERIRMENERVRKEQERIQREKDHLILSIEAKCEEQNQQLELISGVMPKLREIKQWNHDGTLIKEASEIQALVREMKSKIGAAASDDIETLKQKSRTCDVEIAAIRERIKAFYQQVEDSSQDLGRTLSEMIAKGFQNSESDESSALSEYKNNQITELKDLQSEDYLPAALQVRIQEAIAVIQDIQTADFLENYAALTIIPLKKEIHSVLRFHKEYGEQYQKLLIQYQVFCEELDIHHLQIFSYDSTGLTELQKAIHLLRDEADKRAEQSLIQEEIDDVMRDMGYDVIGSRNVSKKNGTQFHNELYQYGDGNAINVTYSSSGQISMELGRLDVTDRMPSAEEAIRLKEQMKLFCGDFKMIEEELLKRGIQVGSRFSLLPPDTAFAQIINTSDYLMHKTTEKKEERRQRENKQEVRHLPND